MSRGISKYEQTVLRGGRIFDGTGSPAADGDLLIGDWRIRDVGTGDRAVPDGALAMAWTVIDVATSEDQRSRLLSGAARQQRAPR